MSNAKASTAFRQCNAMRYAAVVFNWKLHQVKRVGKRCANCVMYNSLVANPFIRPPVCLSVCLSVYLSVSPSVSLSVSVCFGQSRIAKESKTATDAYRFSSKLTIS